MIWEPIISEELSLEISKAEKEMSSENFFKLYKNGTSKI